MILIITMMTETVRISETSVYSNETSRRWIAEGSHLHTVSLENLKSAGLLFFSQMMYEYGAAVELWQGKPKNSIRKLIPVPLCAPQIARDVAATSVLRGRLLTAWAAEPRSNPFNCPCSFLYVDYPHNSSFPAHTVWSSLVSVFMSAADTGCGKLAVV
jgi:hypothetical protein